MFTVICMEDKSKSNNNTKVICFASVSVLLPTTMLLIDKKAVYTCTHTNTKENGGPDLDMGQTRSKVRKLKVQIPKSRRLAKAETICISGW